MNIFLDKTISNETISELILQHTLMNVELNQNILNEGLTKMRELVILQNGILSKILYILLVFELVKLIIFIKNKKRFKNALINILTLSIPYAFIGSLTLIVSAVYHSKLNANIFIFTLTLIPIALIGLIYVYYDNIINAFKNFSKSLVASYNVLIDLYNEKANNREDIDESNTENSFNE